VRLRFSSNVEGHPTSRKTLHFHLQGECLLVGCFMVKQVVGGEWDVTKQSSRGDERERLEDNIKMYFKYILISFGVVMNRFECVSLRIALLVSFPAASKSTPLCLVSFLRYRLCIRREHKSLASTRLQCSHAASITLSSLPVINHTAVRRAALSSRRGVLTLVRRLFAQHTRTLLQGPNTE
jgi:hypothetical protein